MLSVLKIFYSALNKSERLKLFQVLILVFLVGIMELVGIASILPIISVMTNPEILDNNIYLIEVTKILKSFGILEKRDVLLFLGFFSFSMIALSTALRIIGVYITTRFIELRRHSFSSFLLRGYLNNPYSFFLINHSADLSKTILSEVDRIIAQIVRPIINMISFSFVLFFIMSFLLYIEPVVTLLAALILSIYYSLSFLTFRNRLKHLGEQTVESNKVRFQVVDEAFSNVKYIKLRKLEDYYSQLFEEGSKVFSSSVASQFILNQIPKYLLELIVFGILILFSIVIVISGLAIGENKAIGVFPLLGAYVLSAYRLQPAVQAVFNGFVSLRYGQAAIVNLNQAMLKVSSTKTPNKKDRTINFNFDKGINLKNISFKYPESKNFIIENLDLLIPEGTTIGIVGATGSGKSTLISILMGLVRPLSGSIIIGDKVINDENISSWQELIGYVPQDITLLDASIVENIAFSNSTKDIDIEFAIECGIKANIDKTLLGSVKNPSQMNIGEDGVKLSGGQRQRIGIARALYTKPKLLILDEPTSALDSKTESIVMDSIEEIGKDKIVIIISHLQSTLSNCDLIFELRDKKVIEL